MRNKQKITTGLAALTLMALFSINFAFAETATTETTETHERQEQEKTNLKEARLKIRAAKAQAIIRLEQNQVSRAQSAIDKLSSILERIEGLEVSEETETGESELNDLIVLAKKQKVDAQKSLDDVKAKAKSLKDALTAASADTTVAAPSKPVKDFMASIKALKQDLIEFHKTLVQIIKEFKAHQQEEKESMKTEKTEESHNHSEESGEEHE